MDFKIQKPNQEIKNQLAHKINNKTKPPGSLGRLEEIAQKIGLIQQTLTPELSKPSILVFSGDHGIATEGVSPFPQEVTQQMVLNFISKGAAINVFAKQNGMDISIIDAGVKGQFGNEAKHKIRDLKIAEGTNSFLHGSAMTSEQCQKAILAGAEMVNERYNDGCNIIGFGEMGIGNTSSSAMLMHLITGESLETCVGKGTGLNEEGIDKKRKILAESLKHYQQNGSPIELLAHFGGFELAMIAGAFLQAASNKMTIMVDGFNVTAALLVAYKIEPNVLEYCIFAHKSDEKGHQKMLEYLNAKPLLNLDMRLGEGTGAAVAYPLIQASVNFLNQMASFEEAGVSNTE